MGDVGAEVLSVRLGLRARWERVNDVVLDAAVGLAGRCRCGEERVNDGEPGRCIGGWAACSAREAPLYTARTSETKARQHGAKGFQPGGGRDSGTN